MKHFCQCGCGQEVTFAKQTSTREGWVKGQPKRFVHGHQSRVELSGRTFGKLKVLGKSPRLRHWLCQCTCGLTRAVRSDHLLLGEITGCRSCSCAFKTHGLSKTPGYILWLGAKMRARKRGLPFTIKTSDIVIPKYCPLLGVPLGIGTRSVYTASVDQIVPGSGYVPGNVWVISWRANQIKSDLTLAQWEEFISVLRAVTGAAKYEETHLVVTSGAGILREGIGPITTRPPVTARPHPVKN